MSKAFLIFTLLLTVCCNAAAQKKKSNSSVERARPPAATHSPQGPLAHNSLIAVSPRQVSLCAQDEQVIWSCEIANRKIASVCASKQLDKAGGYLQYRFGLPGKIELQYPQQREDTQTAFAYYRYTRPLVTYLGLRFKINEYEYEVYDNTNDEADGGREAGVNVTPAGDSTRMVDYRCRKHIVRHLIELEDIVPNTEMTPGGP